MSVVHEFYLVAGVHVATFQLCQLNLKVSAAQKFLQLQPEVRCTCVIQHDGLNKLHQPSCCGIGSFLIQQRSETS